MDRLLEPVLALGGYVHLEIAHMHGVYATFTGPLPQTSRVWAALLYGGAAAVLSHGTFDLEGCRGNSQREVRRDQCCQALRCHAHDQVLRSSRRRPEEPSIIRSISLQGGCVTAICGVRRQIAMVGEEHINSSERAGVYTRPVQMPGNPAQIGVSCRYLPH